MKKCVIITTINQPSSAIKKHIDNPNYDVIIVGDNKTPDSYKNLNCIFLDIESQHRIFPVFSKLLPENHYCRKNIGYLYAIDHKYDIIYETDDDTEPYENFDSCISYKYYDYSFLSSNHKWVNFLKYFTDDFIWPRGFPLSQIRSDNTFQTTANDLHIQPSIISGLIDNDPDVDSIYRLIYGKIPNFQNKKPIIIDNKNICVFNAQNTFWINKDLFLCLYVPCSVSFRYCDILRGIIANIIMKYKNLYSAYTYSNVIQYRNEHDLIKDFQSEYSMFIGNENIIDFIEKGCDTSLTTKQLIYIIYGNLYNKNYIQKQEIDLLENWLVYF
jgi:hypothetical protein